MGRIPCQRDRYPFGFDVRIDFLFQVFVWGDIHHPGVRLVVAAQQQVLNALTPDGQRLRAI
jgi:hypothetical protein